jgi:hypothetical protein
MDLIRFNPDMGKLVSLVFAVLHDVRWLFTFLMLNIIQFAFYYLSLGYQLTKEGSLKDKPVYWEYFIESWKIATKGSYTEISSVWSESKNPKYEPLQDGLMVLTILNEIYLKIIILSFLIAVVGKTFKTQGEIEKQTFYEQRCDMNKECSNVYNQIGILDFQDMFVLSC